MPGPTNTELIRHLQDEVVRLSAALGPLREQLERADFVQVRERLAVVEQRLAEFDAARAQFERLAVIEDRLGELAKWKDEREKRNWQLLALGVGAVLSLLGGIVVHLVLFALRTQPAVSK
jgi:tetrahydromethanopterin S-methyltransferase subunit G